MSLRISPVLLPCRVAYLRGDGPIYASVQAPMTACLLKEGSRRHERNAAMLLV